MKFESAFISKLIPYKLSSHRAWELAHSNNILKLDWNEASIPPSPLVIEKVSHALKSDALNWYPDVDNKLLLYKIATYSEVDISEVLYFASSDCIHEYLIRAFVQPFDKLLIIGPTYDNFRSTAESSGASIHFFKLNEDFKLELNSLQETIDNIAPKLVYIVNPNNPTGTIIAPIELKNLITKNPNSLFIIDEAYYEFAGQTVSHCVSDYENLIITRTFSKAFALASFRIGYLISNKININTLKKIRNAKSIPLLSQVAAEAALDSLEYTKKYILEVTDARDLFYKYLQSSTHLTPYLSYANFIFIRVQTNDMKYELLRFLENKFIFIRDYKHVSGVENFIRISIGTKNQMKFVTNEITNFFETYE
jgi:histidinol-phosphate aminotransferase